MSENTTIEKKEFASEIVRNAVKITNERLEALNLPTYSQLKATKKQNPNDYQKAITIFKASLQKELNKIFTDIIEAFNDNL